jgi:hypothetical protein
MHPDLLIAIARQRGLELRADAAAARRVPRRAGASVRARLGRRLVRLGHRLAPVPPRVVASPNARRPATMGP